MEGFVGVSFQIHEHNRLVCRLYYCQQLNMQIIVDERGPVLFFNWHYALEQLWNVYKCF